MASGVGYAAIKRDIFVIPGKSLFLHLELDRSSGQLKEVTVSSRKNRQRNQASTYAVRMPLTNLENPQVLKKLNGSVKLNMESFFTQ